MRWKAKDRWGWRRTFAFLPVEIDGEVIWCEWYERRFCGDHYEVRATLAETQPDERTGNG